MSRISSTTKVFLLMAGLTGLLGAIGHALGGKTGLMVAIALAAVTNVAMYFWSSRLVLRMYRARVVTEREAPGLYRLVDRLRRRAGLPMPTVAVAPHDQPNAFATGRSPAHGVVCVTQGLLDFVSPEELEGVVAHELAHIRNRDMLLQTVTATLAGAVSNVANIAAFGSLFGARDEEGDSPGLLGGFLAMLVAPIAASLVQLAISRQREFDADRGAAVVTGRPLALGRGLRKLELGARRIPMDVSPAGASLAIVNPLAAFGDHRLARWFSTHPPTAERVARLEQLVSPTLRRVA
jgi:heat shock protein HtpX